MRCKACNKEHERDDELCTTCDMVSQLAAKSATDEESRVDTRTDTEFFTDFIVKRNLREVWRGGLGLMDPEKRAAHMQERAWRKFQDLRRSGMPRYKAAAQATGRLQGNAKSAYKGLRHASVADSGGDQGQSGGSPVNFLGSDTLSWDRII